MDSDLELQMEEEQQIPYRIEYGTTLAPPVESNTTGNGTSNQTTYEYQFYQVRKFFKKPYNVSCWGTKDQTNSTY